MEGAEKAWWLNRPYTAAHILEIARLLGVRMTWNDAELFIKAMAFMMKGPLKDMPEIQTQFMDIQNKE